MAVPLIEMTEAEWNAEGEARFGADRMRWKFKCPVCGHIASAQDWKDAGASSGAVAFSCLGRWMETPRRAFEEKGKGPCNYAGGGFFRLNPVKVRQANGEEFRLFEFAEKENACELAR